ncbi:MAG: hypothetical protein RLZZ241_1295 [Bacteroidota bacterium]|jgi:glycosyltransferase involved in cell wall biosynthesis
MVLVPVTFVPGFKDKQPYFYIFVTMNTMPAHPEISVIISTYKAEAWLEKVLWGYQSQCYKGFEVIIADDGSGPETKALLDRLRPQVFYDIIHVWQEDDGFQKSKILNKAIEACNSEYILMSDGDCIPREDFVGVHFQHRKQGFFLSGGYFMLPMNISEVIGQDDVVNQRCFHLNWLRQHGLSKSIKNLKLTAGNRLAKLLNTITPTRASWNGHNSSGWKLDILKVNGFDERMQYGGQDRELGERLMNLGVQGKQLRYSAICVHLDHKRGYKTQDSILKNAGIRKTTRTERRTWTHFGIFQKREA